MRFLKACIVTMALLFPIGCGGGGSGGDGGSTIATISGSVYQSITQDSVSPSGGTTVSVGYPSTSGKPLLRKTEIKTVVTESDGSFTVSGVPKTTGVKITVTKDGHTLREFDNDTTAGDIKITATVQRKNKSTRRIAATQGGSVNTFDQSTLPTGEVTIPANALSADADLVLTTFHLADNLPKASPQGFSYLAGGELHSATPLNFAVGADVRPYVVLPQAVKAEELTGVDIKLMEYVNGSWVIKGKAIINPPKGFFLRPYLGPDASDSTSRLTGTFPFCFVTVVTNPASISGKVTDTSGNPIEGATVMTKNRNAITDKNGGYTLTNVLVKDSGEFLVSLSVFKINFHALPKFILVKPGQNLTDINFVLESIISELAEVSGRVSDSSSNPIANATVRVKISEQIRRLYYSDSGTPLDLTDDTFSVVIPQGVIVSSYKWRLTTPSGNVFTSTAFTGSSVGIHQLMVEAAGANVTLSVGSYRVELILTLLNGNTARLSGGFLLNLVGLSLEIADIDLPLSFVSSQTIEALTNSSGNYKALGVPIGVLLEAQCSANGFITSLPVTIAPLTIAEKKVVDFTLAAQLTDTQSPTTPLNLVSTTSQNSVTLSWAVSTDNVQVKGYKILRNGVVVGITAEATFTDMGLSGGSTYNYQIIAFDAAGNESTAASTSVSVPVLDTTAPTFGGVSGLTASNSNTIKVSWGPAIDNVSSSLDFTYLIYIATSTGSQNFSATNYITPQGVTSYTISGLSSNTTYYVVTRALDRAGNIDTNTNELQVATPATADTSAPTFAGSSPASANSPNSVTLSWGSATDNVTVSGQIVYLVYRSTISGTFNYSVANYQSAAGATTITITGLNSSTTYYFVIRAKDLAGNIDTNTVEQTVTTPAPADTTVPTFSGLSSATAAGSSSVNLSWTAATDNVTAQSNIVYLVYISTASGGQNFTTPNFTTTAGVTSYTVTGLSAATTFYFVVRAKDETGNIDVNTVERSATTQQMVDVTAPTFGGVSSPTVNGMNSITLSWTAGSDNVTAATNLLYLIYISLSQTGFNYTTPNYTTSAGAVSYTVTGLASGTTYYFVTRAKDEAGNIDSNTVSMSATTSILSLDSPATDIKFVGVNGWVLTGGGLYKTTNSGSTWSQVSSVGGHKISFVDNLQGYKIQTDKMAILKTTDGGATWSIVYNSTSALNDVQAVTPSIIYLACQHFFVP